MSEDISFKGDVVIISGAGSGIGRSHALELGRRGAEVVVNDILRENADEVVNLITSEGGVAIPSYDTAGSYEGTKSIVAAAVEQFGTVDVLINNAGNFPFGYFEELTEQDAVNVMNVHLLGYFWLAQAAWPVMKARGAGRIVMTSSCSGMFSHPGLSNYAAAKAGVYGLTKALSFEGADHGIRVNAVLPGAQTTPVYVPGFEDWFPDLENRMDHRRAPELITHLVAYLVSRECTATGEAYSAMGSRYARVFTGVADGWLPETTEGLSVEAVRDHFDLIRDASKFKEVTSATEEVDQVAARLELLRPGSPA